MLLSVSGRGKLRKLTQLGEVSLCSGPRCTRLQLICVDDWQAAILGGVSGLRPRIPGISVRSNSAVDIAEVDYPHLVLKVELRSGVT